MSYDFSNHLNQLLLEVTKNITKYKQLVAVATLFKMGQLFQYLKYFITLFIN